MKKISLVYFIIMLFFINNLYAQKTLPTLTNLSKLDIGVQGVGFSYEKKISPKISNNFSVGLGGSYLVSSKSISYVIDPLYPSIYATSTTKFYYKRKVFANTQLSSLHNSGNYFGAKIKLVLDPFQVNNVSTLVLLSNVHWGLQRAITNRWIINTHLGAGYACDLLDGYGTIYPTIDLNFSYVLHKKKK